MMRMESYRNIHKLDWAQSPTKATTKSLWNCREILTTTVQLWMECKENMWGWSIIVPGMFVRQMHTSILLHICCIYIKVQNPILYSQVMAWLRGDSLVAGFLANQKSSHKTGNKVCLWHVSGGFAVLLESSCTSLLPLCGWVLEL
jgi:hypothetical protein